eukprot:Unigene9472_Nuclearia_a/m.28918 Unigene9472_Nuclearia_a/g.28918  ORF Unigene9472_Nuclearia_a/g.28918 Unigene9472_Nuclearia_a/m.28918 type:complete len:389 (-) Unigene9472_Nuclearia_a:1-1167(-)
MITSSGSTWWLMPTRCGLCLVLVPQTSAYLNCAASVRCTQWHWRGRVSTVARITSTAAHHMLHGRAAPQDQPAGKVRVLAAPLGVDADQVQVLPDLLDQVVQVEVLGRADHDRVGQARQPVHFLDGHLINLVVAVEALHVLAPPDDNVDKLVGRRVLADDDLSVEDLVLVQDHVDHLLVQVRELDRRVERDAAALLDLEVDVGWPRVEPDADVVQLLCQKLALDLALARVNHHQHHVGRARGRDDLAAAALALRGALDNAGQVEQLDLGAVVLDLARDARQRRKLVARRDALRARDLGQQRRLAHGREADERHARVAALHHVEALALLPGRLGRLEQLLAQLGDARFEQAEVVLGRLVLLRAGHLGLDVGDALEDPHGWPLYVTLENI